MNYSDGVTYMKDLTTKLDVGETSSFIYGKLKINYPGFKNYGDYKLTLNGNAPKHTDLVQEFYDKTTSANYNNIVNFLEDIYSNGLKAKTTIFNQDFINLIYWITLQEEINYPQPRFKGRKLTFQRFFEGVYSKIFPNIISIESVLNRTNNHGGGIPSLLNIKKPPIFYN